MAYRFGGKEQKHLETLLWWVLSGWRSSWVKRWNLISPVPGIMAFFFFPFPWTSSDELNQLPAKSLEGWRKWASRGTQICLSSSWLDFSLPLAFSLPIAIWPTYMPPLQIPFSGLFHSAYKPLAVFEK